MGPHRLLGNRDPLGASPSVQEEGCVHCSISQSESWASVSFSTWDCYMASSRPAYPVGRLEGARCQGLTPESCAVWATSVPVSWHGAGHQRGSDRDISCQLLGAVCSRPATFLRAPAHPPTRLPAGQPCPRLMPGTLPL